MAPDLARAPRPEDFISKRITGFERVAADYLHLRFDDGSALWLVAELGKSDIPSLSVIPESQGAIDLSTPLTLAEFQLLDGLMRLGGDRVSHRQVTTSLSRPSLMRAQRSCLARKFVETRPRAGWSVTEAGRAAWQHFPGGRP